MKDDTTKLRPPLSDRDAQLIVQTKGRALVERYWGRYVAFIHHRCSHEINIIRDPTGGIPCFFTAHHGVNLYFSNIEDVFALGIRKFRINWSYIAAYTYFRGLQIRETGVDGVFEVQAGECITLKNFSQRAEFYWNPTTIFEASTIEDPHQAAADVRRVTEACVGAWATCYPSIIHALSGGLDSSIVFSCLTRRSNRPNITCYNYSSPTIEGDERFYARLMVNDADCEYVEVEQNSSESSFQPLLDMKKSPQPSTYAYFLEHSAFESELAQEKEAGATFSGSGGDGLFYQHRVAYGASDYAFRHGVRPRLFKIAMDAARAEKTSVWSVLRTAIVNTALRRPWTYYPTTSGSLMQSAASASSVTIDDIVHPWLENAEDVPHGKLWQIITVSVPQFYYEPLGMFDNLERVTPLLSQPLIELCLQIPTYVLTMDGAGRAVARKAFADILPSKVTNRRTKGSNTNHIRDALKSNIGFVRELLLDGSLVNMGILDGKVVEKYLAGQGYFSVQICSELIDHLSTEAWLRTWAKSYSTTE